MATNLREGKPERPEAGAGPRPDPVERAERPARRLDVGSALGAEVPEWLADPGVRHLFHEFPLPLVVVALDTGDVLANRRFGALFDGNVLRRPPLRDLLGAPGLAWQTVRVYDRAGGERELRARALHTPVGAMLVLDGPGIADPGAIRQIDELHARIAELEHLSATDRLTGAWNRGHFDRTVPGELARSLRLRQPLSLVLIDVDHFKRVNDAYGHAAGDAVLRELVRVVRAEVRASDLVFRWGGEEFAVLTFASGYRQAAALAGKLRAAVEAHAFPTVGRLTVSLGVAEHCAAESAAAWFERADAQLYAAKRDGRNRVATDARGSSDEWQQAGQRGALRLAWRTDYECGEPTIDEQHRRLFDLANVLIDAASGAQADAASLDAAFAGLIDHVVRHFRDEEALLEAAGYAKLEQHARAHARLVDRAATLKAAAEAGQVSFAPVVDFLANDVVARHLFTADRDFFPLFADGPPRRN